MVNQSNDQDQEFESRTQKKHFAHSMVDLAHKLAEMKHSDMILLPISEQIIDTVVASKKITSHIARKRHFQFIGKLLLNSDHEAVIEAMQDKAKKHEAGLIRQPFISMWAEKVIEDDSIIDQLYETHEHTDIQPLRQLVRLVIKQKGDLKKQKRKLFEYIRFLDNQVPLPPI
ncbi:MAG: ribosome biogenesis factor YjgA [Marinicellaceae bacterium]